MLLNWIYTHISSLIINIVYNISILQFFFNLTISFISKMYWTIIIYNIFNKYVFFLFKYMFMCKMFLQSPQAILEEQVLKINRQNILLVDTKL